MSLRAAPTIDYVLPRAIRKRSCLISATRFPTRRYFILISCLAVFPFSPLSRRNCLSSGAIREYIVNKSGIENPPALNISIPVDLRGVNDGDASSVGVHYVLLTTPLPTDVEGNHGARLYRLREVHARWQRNAMFVVDRNR